METISKSIRKTNKVIIVEECMKTGGIGAELIALITEECFDDLDADQLDYLVRIFQLLIMEILRI